MSEFYGAWDDVYQQGLQQGLDKGKIEGSKEIVEKMLKTNKYPVEDISALTSISVEDIEKIKRELSSPS